MSARGLVAHSTPIGIARRPDKTEEQEDAEYRRQTQEDKGDKRGGHRRRGEPPPQTGGQVSRQAAAEIDKMMRHAEEGGYQHVNVAKRQRATEQFRKLLDTYRGSEIQRINAQLKTASGVHRSELVSQKRAIVAERVRLQGRFDEAMRTPARADAQRHYVRGAVARPYHETRPGVGGYAQPDFSISKSSTQGKVWYHVNLKSHKLKGITPADARAIAREVSAQAIRNATGDPRRRGDVGHLPSGDRIIVSFIDMPDDAIRKEMNRILLAGDGPIEEVRFGTATSRRVVPSPVPPPPIQTPRGPGSGSGSRRASTGDAGAQSRPSKGLVFGTGTQSTLPKGSVFENQPSSLPKGSVFENKSSLTPSDPPVPNTSRPRTVTSTPIGKPAGTSMKVGRVAVDIDTGGSRARPIKRVDIDLADFSAAHEPKPVPGLSKAVTVGALAVTMASLIGQAAGGEAQENIEKVIEPIRSHFKGVLQEARVEFHSTFPDPGWMWRKAGIDELRKTYDRAVTKLKSPQAARAFTAVLLALTPVDQRDDIWHQMAEMVRNKKVGIQPADLRSFIEGRNAYEAGMVQLLEQLQQYDVSALPGISADLRKRARLLLSIGSDLQDIFWRLMSSPLGAFPLTYYPLWSIYGVAGTFLELGGRLAGFVNEVETRASDYQRISRMLDAALIEVGNRHPF